MGATFPPQALRAAASSARSASAFGVGVVIEDAYVGRSSLRADELRADELRADELRDPVAANLPMVILASSGRRHPAQLGHGAAGAVALGERLVVILVRVLNPV